MDNYHLLYDGGCWKLKVERGESSLAEYDQRAAVTGTRKIVTERGGSLKIHGTCRMEEERTYPRSADPRATPG